MTGVSMEKQWQQRHYSHCRTTDSSDLCSSQREYCECILLLRCFNGFCFFYILFFTCTKEDLGRYSGQSFCSTSCLNTATNKKREKSRGKSSFCNGEQQGVCGKYRRYANCIYFFFTWAHTPSKLMRTPTGCLQKLIMKINLRMLCKQATLKTCIIVIGIVHLTDTNPWIGNNPTSSNANLLNIEFDQ